MLQTVGRAGQVLDLFSTDNPEWGATAVANALDVAKSQAHELLISLADIGLLERHGPGRYRLGWRVIALNTLVVDSSHLGAEPTRVLAALAAQTGHAAHLATWGPGSAICVASYAGRDAFGPPPAAVGSALAVHATAAGKVLLAAQPAETIADHAARDLTPFTDRTIRTAERLARECAAVRQRGFAYEEQERDPAACAVAAPIRDLHGHVVAALGLTVAAPRWRATARDQTRAVAAAAARCSELLRKRALTTSQQDRFGIAERPVDRTGNPVA
ncbi:IclR family transcriptional regulator [Conexibacter woesei]|uniref:IclR family transcriptional regulator n=1 Tax=Conexibacter woesei TaxID=191495 RepID=UPI000423A0E6|nr:IclR family transcriptional regulator [Conexibacter woesei]